MKFAAVFMLAFGASCAGLTAEEATQVQNSVRKVGQVVAENGIDPDKWIKWAVAGVGALIFGVAGHKTAKLIERRKEQRRSGTDRRVAGDN